jgi:tetratricopeptide (TPR) repeat protein
MNLDPTKIAERLATGASLSSVVVSVLPEDVRSTLGRCAVARTFDVELYDGLLRGDQGPALSEMVGQSRVEQVSPGRYQVCDALRDGAWESWWMATSGSAGVPEDLRRFSTTLAEASHEAGAPLDELRHLLLADQARARELLVRLFDEADARLDLAACHNVLAVLAEPALLPLLEPETLTLLRDRQLHVQARDMWYLEHHQSARYLSRRELEERLARLVRGEPGRVLQLYARGGMGKTMQLRWFIARYCVPRRIPCARLDFDVLDPINAANHPWLLLLECARQLNRQMERAPFTELLREHGAYLTVLGRQHTEAARSGSNALGAAAVARADQDDVLFRFASTLRERGTAEPVVIVLDTLEELVVRPATDPTPVLAALASAVALVPCLRLVLSGRYDLTERIPGIAEVLPDVTSHAVGPFDDEQACRYLTEIRRIERTDLLYPVVRRAGGVPFTLAAFADLVRQDPDLTVAEVDQCDDPALLYCIERVVERIDDDRLQWLLRYGVVPRRLSFDFLVHVMRPFLAQGMAGTDDDRPERDVRPRRSEVFRTGQADFPDSRPDLRALWDGFTEYASDYSWISMFGSEPDTVVFHDEVVRPLRQLLSAQPVFTALHAEAARFYAERAETRPERWLADTKDALYHRLQAGDATARDFWRAALRRARDENRPDCAGELCRELLGRDYFDEDGVPLPSPTGRPMVDHHLLAEAHLQLARVLAEGARAEHWPGDHPQWSDAALSLAYAQRLAEDHEVGLDPVLSVVVEATVLLARDHLDEAAELLRGHIFDPDVITPEDRDALLVHAEVTRELEETQLAIGLYTFAYTCSEQLADRATMVRVALALSSVHLDDGANEDAAVWASLAGAVAGTDEDRDGAVLAEALAWLDAGRPAAAIDRLASTDGPHADYLRAHALLLLRAPGLALDACEVALGQPLLLPPELLPHVLALSAECHAALLDLEHAVKVWMRAIDLCRTVRDLDALAMCAATAARLLAYGTGDLREATQMLAQADRLELTAGGDAWLSVRLTRATLLDFQGRHDAADQVMDEVLADADQRPRSALRLARIAVAGLCLPGRAARYLPMLLASLPEISSPTRRLILLRKLSCCPRLDGVDPVDRARLVELGRAARATDGVAPEDDAVLAFVEAELRRLAGDGQIAAHTLAEGCRRLSGRDPVVWWDWLQAMDRIGPATGGEPPQARTAADDLRMTYPERRTLHGAYLTLLARRRMACDPPEIVRSWLDAAEESLRPDSRPPHRMVAYLYSARAELAKATGDTGAEHRFGGMALAIITELGHPTDTATMLQYELAPDTPLVPASDETTMTMELSGESIRLTMVSPEGHETVFGKVVAARMFTTERRDLVAALVDNPTDWASAVPETREFVEAMTYVGDSRPLRLVLADSVLHGFPWELVRWRHRIVGADRCYRAPTRAESRQAEVRLLQQLLAKAGSDCGPVDGLFGPLTQAGVREFQRRFGLPASGVPRGVTWKHLNRRVAIGDRQASVLVVQPSLLRVLGGQRATPDLDIRKYYRRHSSVAVLENPRQEDLDRIADDGSLRPDIVHVRAMVEVVQGTPYLDFAGMLDYTATGHFENSPERLHVTALARFVQKVSRDGMMPLVVLDILTPSSRHEAMRQLLLRNEFAHQLLALGTVRSIVASGVGAPEEHDQFYTDISHVMSEQVTPARIARCASKAQPATAFLSLVPPSVLPPVWV